MRAGLAGDAHAYHRALEGMTRIVRTRANAELSRLGAGNADVEDVVQETLLAIHLKRHTWDSALPLLPWVNAIVRHKVLDHVRRQYRRAATPIEDVSNVLSTPPADDGVTASEIARLLDRLTPPQREVVKSLTIDGLEVRDVARQLGKQEGTVRVILHRGLAALSRLCREVEARQGSATTAALDRAGMEKKR